MSPTLGPQPPVPTNWPVPSVAGKSWWVPPCTFVPAPTGGPAVGGIGAGLFPGANGYPDRMLATLGARGFHQSPTAPPGLFGTSIAGAPGAGNGTGGR